MTKMYCLFEGIVIKTKYGYTGDVKIMTPNEQRKQGIGVDLWLEYECESVHIPALTDIFMYYGKVLVVDCARGGKRGGLTKTISLHDK
jgi:hypothetical protein